MRSVTRIAALVAVVSASGGVFAQDFPEGQEGELYYAPRLDLVEGGALSIELDGELSEDYWTNAHWQGFSHILGTAPTDKNDADFIWAAAADQEFLYVAWRVLDDVMNVGQQPGCDVWRDDSIEIYIDAKNNGPDCTEGDSSCYEPDDAQLTIGLDQFEVEDPELLLIGGLAGGGACDFSMPEPDLIQGIVAQVTNDDEEYIGWQGEVAIALETIGTNGGDGTPEWVIDPDHGTVIGFGFQLNDDDDGEDTREHKLTWALIEDVESAWRNPGAFGKLMFVDPKLEPPPLLTAVRDVSCDRNEDGTVAVSWTNPDSADPEVETTILVDGEEAGSAPGDAEGAELPADAVPDDGEDHVITVVNNSTQGAECTFLQSDFDSCGGIREWNILGGYLREGGAAPGDDAIRLDYMTDGDISETDFEWRPGAELEPDVGGASAATAVNGGAAGRAPGGIPTVFSRRAASGRVNLNAEFGGQIEQIMAYAQTYVIVEEPMDVHLGIASDDSIQVLLNGEEVFLNNIGRGGADCANQDFTFDPVELEEGVNSLMVKVFNGVGGWDFTIRFQDGGDLFSEIVTEGISISSTPPGGPPVELIRRGDANDDGAVNIADMIYMLNGLFGDGSPPPCLEAAEMNGDNAYNIADAIYGLNRLFGTGPPPVGGHGPDGTDCGADPEPENSIGCESTTSC